MDESELLQHAAKMAEQYVAGVADRPVGAQLDPTSTRARLTDTLNDAPVDPADVLDEMVAQMEPGITAMGSPRYFGFVIGGTLPVALAADWLVSAWDQNAGLTSPTPAAAAVEEVAGTWLLEVLGLPATASFAFVTGCQMAHVTALAAARHRVLANVGWDVEADGLVGAPAVRVLVGDERHVTVDRALRILGLGRSSIVPVATDADGAMDPDALRREFEQSEDLPTIVCAQAGNVNTGAVDPLETVVDVGHAHGAWVHVDGAFGLWAAAAPERRAALAGCERADSWATDTHKWLNTPYDCGFAAVTDRDAHRAAMSVHATYLQQGETVREPLDWNPDFSRRARAVPTYAALRALGRDGVAELVERLCSCADRFAAQLSGADGFTILARGLNQVLVGIDDEQRTDEFVDNVQREGTCWMSATTWRGRRCMRISVSNWRTTPLDVDRSVSALMAVQRSMTERE